MSDAPLPAPAAALPALPPRPTPWAAAVRLHSLPQDAARRALATGAPAFVLVNPVEYHGPHLSLHNDHLLSRGLAGWLHACWAPHFAAPGESHGAAPAPFLVVDELELGVDPAPGPGSVATPAPVVRRRVVQAVEGLLALGARKIVLVTFHGAPLHSLALHGGVERAWAAGARAFAPMASLLPRLGRLGGLADTVLDHVREPAARERVARSLATDFHGGFVETSLALALAPAGVSPAVAQVPDCPAVVPWRAHRLLAGILRAVGAHESADLVRAGADGAAWGALDPHPGHTGVPSQATAAAGNALLQAILPGLAAEGLAVLQGSRTPRPPPLGWLWTLSLGGRLPL